MAVSTFGGPFLGCPQNKIHIILGSISGPLFSQNSTDLQGTQNTGPYGPLCLPFWQFGSKGHHVGYLGRPGTIIQNSHHLAHIPVTLTQSRLLNSKSGRRTSPSTLRGLPAPAGHSLLLPGSWACVAAFCGRGPTAVLLLRVLVYIYRNKDIFQRIRLI